MLEKNIKISFTTNKNALSTKLYVKLDCSESFYNFYSDKKVILSDKKVKIECRYKDLKNFRILIGDGYHASDIERFTILKKGTNDQIIYFSNKCNVEEYKKKVLIMLKLMSDNLK